MSNVAQLLPGGRALVTLTESRTACKLVQEELLRAKRTYKDVAQSAALAHSTVSNIASGNTRLPRIETIIRILSALGWRIIAQRRGAGMTE